jgi:hypothetical protein
MGMSREVRSLMTVWRLTAIASALVTGVLLSLPSIAAAAQIQCGDTISANATLTADLVGCADGLTVDGTLGSGPVTLDLAGHTIRGTGSGAGITATNATVRNGSVAGFRTGIAILLAGTAERLAITGNGTGIEVEGGFSIIDNVIVGNGTGILALRGNGGTVRGNRIALNGAGFFAATGGGGLLFADNMVIKNSGRGVFVDNMTATIVGNTVSMNGRDGIWVTDSFFPLFFPYWFANNVADLNGGFGIAFFGVPTSTLPPYTVDGGGNVARLNANPEQCHNIVCAVNRGRSR